MLNCLTPRCRFVFESVQPDDCSTVRSACHEFSKNEWSCSFFFTIPTHTHSLTHCVSNTWVFSLGAVLCYLWLPPSQLTRFDRVPVRVMVLSLSPGLISNISDSTWKQPVASLRHSCCRDCRIPSAGKCFAFPAESLTSSKWLSWSWGVLLTSQLGGNVFCCRSSQPCTISIFMRLSGFVFWAGVTQSRPHQCEVLSHLFPYTASSALFSKSW